MSKRIAKRICEGLNFSFLSFLQRTLDEKGEFERNFDIHLLHPGVSEMDILITDEIVDVTIYNTDGSKMVNAENCYENGLTIVGVIKLTIEEALSNGWLTKDEWERITFG